MCGRGGGGGVRATTEGKMEANSWPKGERCGNPIEGEVNFFEHSTNILIFCVWFLAFSSQLLVFSFQLSVVSRLAG